MKTVNLVLPEFKYKNITITTNQGRNFESHLYRELTNILGTHRNHSTPHHPKFNVAIERFHRQLKSAIFAHNQPIRSAVKNDINATWTELAYGTTLRLTYCLQL